MIVLEGGVYVQKGKTKEVEEEKWRRTYKKRQGAGKEVRCA